MTVLVIHREMLRAHLPVDTALGMEANLRKPESLVPSQGGGPEGRKE